MKTIHQDGFEIKLDLTKQVLELDILTEPEFDIPQDREIGLGGRSTTAIEAELYPSVKDIRRWGSDFVSASILVAKAKQFDDGLYAAVELLCQYGTDGFVGKQEILRRIAQVLRTFTKEKNIERRSLTYCRGFINAASNIGGQQISEPSDIEIRAQKIKTKFSSNQLRSKPIGFYTWTKELSRIFQQDRLLQEELKTEIQIRLLARAMSQGENTLKAYKAHLEFLKRLTNPFPPDYGDLSAVEKTRKTKKYGFFPPSRAHETELGKRLYGRRSIPDGFSLIDTLVQRIQEGEIHLTPKGNSGWYDYQISALEPFVNPKLMPESRHLYFSHTYKKELIELFKSAIALTRETHMKQLISVTCGAAGGGIFKPTIYINPEISVEPIATYYLRRAESYSFVRELLQSTFGETALKSAFRLTASGEVAKDLLSELTDMESLFYGVYQIVAEEIGMAVHSRKWRTASKDEDSQFARKWIRTFTRDPDVGTDNRMMVPIFYDIERKKTKVWVVLGYAAKPLSVSFKKRPTVLAVADSRGKEASVEIEFGSTMKSLAYPVSAEIYVDKLLNRSEFRALCDKYKTQSAILEALQHK